MDPEESELGLVDLNTGTGTAEREGGFWAVNTAGGLVFEDSAATEGATF